MNYACKFCIALKGLKGEDIGNLPTTVDDVIVHIERVHRYMVVRHGETKEVAKQRFMEIYGTEPKSVRDIFPHLERDHLTLRVLDAQIGRCAWVEARVIG